MNEWILIWTAAVASTALGIGFLAHTAWIVATWPKAVGRIVGNHPVSNQGEADTSLAYLAEISFTARDGRTYSVSSDVARNAPWPPGSAIDVHYRESDPRQAMTMVLWQRLVFAAAFLIPGAVCWALIGGLIAR